MGLFPRSKKKRIIKKWFNRTGYLRTRSYVIRDGIYWYKIPPYILIPAGPVQKP